MRLRNKTQAPERYEDGQYSTQAPHDPTKPAFPDLLAAATICFNPSLPAAAFPSSTTFQAGDEVGNTTFDTTNLDLPLVHNSLSTIGVTSEAHCQQPGFAAVANGDWGTFDAPVWDGIRTFMDEAASSDEEGENAIRYRVCIHFQFTDVHFESKDIFRLVRTMITSPGHRLLLLFRSRSWTTSVLFPTIETRSVSTTRYLT